MLLWLQMLNCRLKKETKLQELVPVRHPWSWKKF